MSSSDLSTWSTRMARVGKAIGTQSRTREYEDEYGRLASSGTSRFGILHETFLEFYFTTLSWVDHPTRRPRWRSYAHFADALWEWGVVYRQFRAALRVAEAGYPTQALALLRDVKDKAIWFCAWSHGVSNVAKWRGSHDLNESERKHFTTRHAAKRLAARIRKKEEDRVFSAILGSRSDIDERVTTVLAAWTGVLHDEVHGAKLLSTVGIEAWASGEAPLILPPLVDENTYATGSYHTYATQLAWMMLRLLPTLQITPKEFPQVWAATWHELDALFRQLILASRGANSHELTDAVIHLVDSKFAFSPTASVYRELP